MTGRASKALAAIAALAAASCAGGPRPEAGATAEAAPFVPPAWFTEGAAARAAAGPPDLKAAPADRFSARDDAAWRALQEELEADGRRLAQDPNARPAEEVSDIAAFEAAARAAVDSTRTAGRR